MFCFQAEGLQAEVEGLKEKLEELTLDLEILRSEISEKGLCFPNYEKRLCLYSGYGNAFN